MKAEKKKRQRGELRDGLQKRKTAQKKAIRRYPRKISQKRMRPIVEHGNVLHQCPRVTLKQRMVLSALRRLRNGKENPVAPRKVSKVWMKIVRLKLTTKKKRRRVICDWRRVLCELLMKPIAAQMKAKCPSSLLEIGEDRQDVVHMSLTKIVHKQDEGGVQLLLAKDEDKQKKTKRRIQLQQKIPGPLQVSRSRHAQDGLLGNVYLAC